MILPKRIWKDIIVDDTLTDYEISSDGKVRNKKTKKILKTSPNKGGYIIARFKGKSFYVHRLVALAFIPNPNDFPQVNHIDENKSNNCIWNLEWCSAKYNTNHGTRNSRASSTVKLNGCRKGDKNPFYNIHLYGSNNPNAKAIKCIELNMIFNTINEAAEFVGGKQSNISMCLNGKTKTAYGYHWEYIN